MIKYYIKEIKRRIQKRSFDKAILEILNTHPLQTSTHGPLVLSMVHHRDVLPYLAAIKSFAKYVDISKVVIIADKTITAEDRQLFNNHITGLTIRDAAEFVRDGIPSGGCWERLVAISNYVENNYVIQLDADTLTISEPTEVIKCTSKNTSFTLGTYDLQSKVSVAEVARWAQSHCSSNINPHIQLLCESNLLHAAGGDDSKVYIRGCAGFAGFAQGSICENDVKTLSTRMDFKMGEIWSKWGTEQFASNYLVSNCTPSQVLPHPVYTTPDLINQTTCFVHFIGPLRYLSGRYKKEIELFLTKHSS